MFEGVRVNMESVDLVIILLHPLIALAVIAWMVKQHQWRERGKLLKGDDRVVAVSKHERLGERLYKLSWLVVITGFVGNALHQSRNLDGVGFFQALLPPSAGALHAAGGVLGLGLVTMLWYKGRKVKSLREQGVSSAREKLQHGRASDVIIALIVIHAFLGFLWLMQLLT